MRLSPKLVAELRVTPGKAASLGRRGTIGTKAPVRDGLEKKHHGREVEHDLEQFKKELEEAQDVLYASDTWAVLVVFQALDAAGKDGTIKHVMSGVNPQGCRVVSFRQPSPEEERHDFLWRCVRVLPERGQIGIFNRSYYEEVLVVRVHPELLAVERLPQLKAGRELWEERYEDINAFERHLVRSGTKVVKFFLHVSKDEQRRRFLDRLDTPEKAWKFSAADLAERAYFEKYEEAYEDMITATSTTYAPWYVIPADDKPAMRALVGGVIVEEIRGLDLTYPPIDAAARKQLRTARARLEKEWG